MSLDKDDVGVLSRLDPLDPQFKAKQIVARYIDSRFSNILGESVYEVYVVWYCKTLQNWKVVLSTTISDGAYYEVTYNGDKQETYLDVYRKFENVCIRDDSVLW